jgi:hypothetical protein
MRLLCYIMETDYTEALTPICISLTNLAKQQLQGWDTEASVSRETSHGGQRLCIGRLDWAGGPAPCHLSLCTLLLQKASTIYPAISRRC